MRLATVRLGSRSSAAIVDNDRVELLAADDVGALLAAGWEGTSPGRGGTTVAIEAVELLNPVPRPEKTICVGLNFHDHAEEANMEPGRYPILFAKYSRSLVGPSEDILLPPVSDAVDWEAELGLVIGRKCRNVPVAEALDQIAGYTVVNDVSMRDWQLRTSQFLQGKTFERSTPVGPLVVSADELDLETGLALGCDVNGTEMQRSSSANMIFSPAEIVSYVSQIITLAPGDLIACGTPKGIGGLKDPPHYLVDGDVLRTWVEGIGELSNTCVNAPTS